MGKFWQDLRCGTLMLAKTPGFTLAALLKPQLSVDPNRRIELEDYQLHAAVSSIAWINILNERTEPIIRWRPPVPRRFMSSRGTKH